MLNTYIQNTGSTQTIMHNNNHRQINKIKWDADYDGDTANISLVTDTDGIKHKYDVSLDNNDLDNLFNIPSVKMPIHKRLENDFTKKTSKRKQNMFYIELPNTDTDDINESVVKPILPQTTSVQSLLPNYYISSPLSNEEFIVPITIGNKHRTHSGHPLTAKKRRRRNRTHNTYKVYKKKRDKMKSKTTRSSSKTKSKHSKRNSSYGLSIF